MGEGANFRNAIAGSFPAVTACAHATIGTGAFPTQHGITGHNIRDEQGAVRKAYGEPGPGRPGRHLLEPTLSDLWSSEETGAWVGRDRLPGLAPRDDGLRGRDPPDDLPVGVYWDEDGAADWRPHNPELYRLPASMPGPERLERYVAGFDAPGCVAVRPDRHEVAVLRPPVVRYQGDLIEATFDSEPIGEGETGLLYINYKSPDYTGPRLRHGRPAAGCSSSRRRAARTLVERMLDERFPGEYCVLIVTADHGQCPLPDASAACGSTRSSSSRTSSPSSGRACRVVESVVPSEVYLDRKALADNGARDRGRRGVARRLPLPPEHRPVRPPQRRRAGPARRPGVRGGVAATFLAELAERDLAALRRHALRRRRPRRHPAGHLVARQAR